MMMMMMMRRVSAAAVVLLAVARVAADDDRFVANPRERVAACAPAYAASLARHFTSPDLEASLVRATILKEFGYRNATDEAAFDDDAPARRGLRTTKEIVFGIGPGSSGTRSTFMAMMLLRISGQHFKQHWVAETCTQRSQDVKAKPDAIEDRDTRYWGDTPVPFTWPRLWNRAPNAKFLMTDVDADRWRAKRLSFRRGYCARAPASKQDCAVPLAFAPPLAVRGLFRLADATPEQTRAAWAAYRAFARCAVPRDRLLWLNLSTHEPRTLWPALLDFVGLPRATALTNRKNETLRLDAANTTFPHWGESGCALQGGTCFEWRCAGDPRGRITKVPLFGVDGA